jgi:hypothetical protein
MTCEKSLLEATLVFIIISIAVSAADFTFWKSEFFIAILKISSYGKLPCDGIVR